MRWSVGVAGWEVECCLGPPAVGGEVAWALTLVEEGRYEPSAPEALVQVRGTVVDAAEGTGLEGRWPVLLDVDGVPVLWEAPHPVEGVVEVEGRIICGEHVGGSPRVPAVVDRVRLVGTLYVEVSAGCWDFAEPHDVQHRDVATSPKRFHDDEGAASPARFWGSLLVDLSPVV